MADFDPSLTFLFDNGSLRAASTLSLRRIARRLQDRLATAVRPVSLLHSSRVDPTELGGEAAVLLEPALERFAAVGGREALLLPLFFGPSGALTTYVPERLAELQAAHPLLEVRLADPLVLPNDDSADLLAAEMQNAIGTLGWTGPVAARHVVVVDHGSPLAEVTAVRNQIAERLAQHLGDTVGGVTAASMERRPGPEYAFNEPLLESALQHAVTEAKAREIIVAMQFLQAGRHAGPGGDVAEICAAALAHDPSVSVRFTPLLGETEAVAQLLERRWRVSVAR